MQGYVNQVTDLLSNSTITIKNSDIKHCLILRKTRVGIEIQNLKQEDWDNICRQCSALIETFNSIIECSKLKGSLDNLIENTGMNIIYGLRFLIGNTIIWILNARGYAY